jgi:hypothetical protein
MNDIAKRSDGFDVATSDQQFNALIRFGDQLVKTQFLPTSIKTGQQAAAIILTGRELGLPPMQALRLISVINGKPTLAAELQLGMFVRRGGHAKWIESTNEKAVLHLTAPNGDEHTETFTIEDAKRAGLTSKQVWSQYPKMMLRARCSTGALRAIDPGNSLYDPEEIGGQAVTAEGEPIQIEEAQVEEIEPRQPAVEEQTAEEMVKEWQPAIETAKTLDELGAVWKSIKDAQLLTRYSDAVNDELTRLKDARKAVLSAPIASKPELTSAQKQLGFLKGQFAKYYFITATDPDRHEKRRVAINHAIGVDKLLDKLGPTEIRRLSQHFNDIETGKLNAPVGEENADLQFGTSANAE